MRTKSVFLLVLLAFIQTFSWAAEGSNTDSSADLDTHLQKELEGFKKDISELSGKALIRSADLLTGAGLSDKSLYAVVAKKMEKLNRSHMAYPKDKDMARELNALIRAYASFGYPESRIRIRQFVEESKSRGVRNRAHRLAPKVVWFADRNFVMQKTDTYKPGQALMTHRFLNLVSSDVATLRRWAAEEIDRRKGTEAVVYEKMRKVLEQEAKQERGNVHLDALAWFCKILKRYDLENSRALLMGLVEDPSVNKKLRKYARI